MVTVPAKDLATKIRYEATSISLKCLVFTHRYTRMGDQQRNNKKISFLAYKCGSRIESSSARLRTNKVLSLEIKFSTYHSIVQ